MYDIITYGGASVDVFVKTKKSQAVERNDHYDVCYHLGDKILVNELVFNTGGGGTNPAVAFSRLGLKTGYVGLVGNDYNGDIILNELKREKVDFLGSIKKGNSGYAIVLADHSDRTILLSMGLNNQITLNDIKMDSLKTNWFYISAVMDKSLETAKALALKLKEDNVKIALSMSPYLAKMGLKEISQLLTCADILMLNREEAETLSYKKTIPEIISTLSKHTSAIIAITDGAEPINAWDGKMMYVKQVKKVKPVDTTGAGDAFAAGFVYGIIKGKSISAAISYGQRESLSVLKYIGAKNRLLTHF